jgi:hypothetical protein
MLKDISFLLKHLQFWFTIPRAGRNKHENDVITARATNVFHSCSTDICRFVILFDVYAHFENWKWQNANLGCWGRF